MNPGFDQPSIHRVLNDPDARATALRSLAELCRVNRFDGIQFDFENFHVADKAAFTAFTRTAVDSVHRAGCSLSAAVVPRITDDPGPAAMIAGSTTTGGRGSTTRRWRTRSISSPT